MTEPNDDAPWVIPPPQRDGYELAVLVGEDVTLTPAASAALETLARELAGDDVAGFMLAAGDGGCFDGVCQPKWKEPCARYTFCMVCSRK